MRTLQKLVVVVVVLLLTLPWSTCLADSSVKVSESRIRRVTAEQERPQWCWAACIQMIMRYYNVRVSQKEIVRRSFGTDPYGNLPDLPGSLEMITRNVNGWGIENEADGKPYAVTCLLTTNPNMIPFVMHTGLEDNRPVLIGYNTESEGVGHAVVVTGITYTGTFEEGNYQITSITVRDPWPGVGKKTYVGSDLGPRIQAAWLIFAKAQEESE